MLFFNSHRLIGNMASIYHSKALYIIVYSQWVANIFISTVSNLTEATLRCNFTAYNCQTAMKHYVSENNS